MMSTGGASDGCGWKGEFRWFGFVLAECSRQNDS